MGPGRMPICIQDACRSPRGMRPDHVCGDAHTESGAGLESGNRRLAPLSQVALFAALIERDRARRPPAMRPGRIFQGLAGGLANEWPGFTPGAPPTDTP